jgi:tricarballylate dehydrogenase
VGKSAGQWPSPDVLVVGGGNAALCAALAARDAGARVLLVEKTAPEWRGGNSKYTRNVRTAGPDYSESEFLRDLVEVSGPEIDLGLARLTIRYSRELPGWMEAHGARWQPAMRGTLQLSRTNRFFLGGGKALLNAYYRYAERVGVEIRYQAEVRALEIEGGVVQKVNVGTPEGVAEIRAGAVVVASGGLEANRDWLRRFHGEAVDNYLVRGSGANDGRLLLQLLEMGAAQRGNPRGFHAVACDARSPQAEGGIVTRVDAIPFGIVVNRDGRRFADEGADLWPKRYASWGGLIAHQPDQLAFSIFDRQVVGRFIPPLYPPYRADRLEDLAAQIGISTRALVETVHRFNRAVDPKVPYDPSRLDGRSTQGIDPPKSNWALALEEPPFFAYPLRPGITFTYLGVAVDERARVLARDGCPFANLFAAGEVMAGNVLHHGYLGGFGMTVGSVFGRIAGEEAARSGRAA